MESTIYKSDFHLHIINLDSNSLVLEPNFNLKILDKTIFRSLLFIKLESLQLIKLDIECGIIAHNKNICILSENGGMIHYIDLDTWTFTSKKEMEMNIF